MSIKNITTQLIDKIIKEFKKQDNVDKIKLHLIDPLIKYSIESLYPYIITISVIFVLTFILAIAIFYIVMKDSFLMK